MGHQNHSYLRQKRGIYYFTRRIPKDLFQHYSSERLYISLKTRNPKEATSKAHLCNVELQQQWLYLRSHHNKGFLSRYLGNGIPKDPKTEDEVPNSLMLSEALEIYIQQKGSNRSKTFEASARRSVGYLINELDDRNIHEYTRLDATRFRDALVERQLATESIKRNLNNIKAIMNFVCNEFGLSEIKVFSSLYIGEQVLSKKHRLPIPQDALRHIQTLSIQYDDEPRWLVALISDTGMRLSEALGLRITDIKLTNSVPHIHVTPHGSRRLKTEGSKRDIPLVGISLWAAKRAIEASNTPFLFPSYCDAEQCKSNSASAALNKWLKKHTHQDFVLHSLRHSFRDRLRSVECPPDIADCLGGWSLKGIGQSYGKGYDLSVLNKWMQKLA